MTGNAIQWYRSLEENRHNRATEKLSRDANRLTRDTLSETSRHNRVAEGETHRSNLRNEDLKYYQAREQARSNRANELLSFQRNSETERSNRANEEIKHVQNAETERSNRANEVIKQGQLAEQERTNRANEVIRQVQNNELERHNRASEVIGQNELVLRDTISRRQSSDSRYAADKHAEASKYGAQLASAASRYNADLNYQFNSEKLSQDTANFVSKLTSDAKIAKDKIDAQNYATDRKYMSDMFQIDAQKRGQNFGLGGSLANTGKDLFKLFK